MPLHLDAKSKPGSLGIDWRRVALGYEKRVSELEADLGKAMECRRDADGDFELVVVTHIVTDADGPWLAPGHCMLSFKVVPRGLWYDPKHTLKTLDPWWSAVARGDKTAELRKNDRDFQVGDVIRLSRVAKPAQD